MVMFEHAKQLEHGSNNAIVARLTVQPMEILNHCKIAKADEQKFVKLSVDELSKRLLRCWEIEQRIRADAEGCEAKFKPPGHGDVSVEVPQIPRLKEDCENFVYEAKNYLRDLLKLFNLLWGTDYEDAADG